MLKMKAFPIAPEAMTAVWLTEVFNKTGVLRGTAVAEITIEPLNGAGYVGQVTRLQLSYDTPIVGAPNTIIAKFSCPDATVRETMHDLYVREVQVYQELMSEIDLPAPHCYYSDIDEKSGHSILLLEDLGHLRMVDIAQGCSPQDAETVVTHFAQHHAQWWDDALLNAIDYLIFENIVDPEWIETSQEWWSHFEDKITTLLPDCFIPASFLELGRIAMRQQQKLVDQTAQSPFTLIHKDTHVDNLMFANTPDDPPLAVIDWQICGSGVGVSDIAYFLISSMSVKTRREHEDELLQIYHATLVKQGVVDYGFEQCWRDYRLAFFRNLMVAVVCANVVDITRPHGRALMNVFISRLASFAEDHNVCEFL